MTRADGGKGRGDGPGSGRAVSGRVLWNNCERKRDVI